MLQWWSLSVLIQWHAINISRTRCHAGGILLNRTTLLWQYSSSARDTYLKLKSRENCVVHNLFLGSQIVLKFCIAHGSDTAVRYAKFQNWQNLTIDVDAIGIRGLPRYVFEMSFGRIPYTGATQITTGEWNSIESIALRWRHMDINAS